MDPQAGVGLQTGPGVRYSIRNFPPAFQADVLLIERCPQVKLNRTYKRKLITTLSTLASQAAIEARRSYVINSKMV